MMKDQVLVIKTNGELGREERCSVTLTYSKYEPKTASPRDGERTRCKHEVMSSWSTIKKKRFFRRAILQQEETFMHLCLENSQTLLLSLLITNKHIQVTFHPKSYAIYMNFHDNSLPEFSLRKKENVFQKLVQHTLSWYANRLTRNICVVQ